MKRYSPLFEKEYRNKGATARVTKVNSKEWYINIIEANLEGEGYASQLMDDIFNDAKKKGVKKIALDASLRSREYFEYTHGFKTLFYDEYDNLYYMEKYLK